MVKRTSLEYAECPIARSLDAIGDWWSLLIIRDALVGRLDALPKGVRVMLKLTLPETADFYMPLIKHAGVARVVALSGGYSRTDACVELAKNEGVIASFSRALLEDLRYNSTDEQFDAALAEAIDEIYEASVDKVAA